MRPFEQIDNSLARKYDGAGLGLPLTKHLVELLGGSLTIKSRVNQGTTVAVELNARPKPGIQLLSGGAESRTGIWRVSATRSKSSPCRQWSRKPVSGQDRRSTGRSGIGEMKKI